MRGRPSILRRLLFSFLGFGLAMGIIFPFYANFFVSWKPGMLPWFIFGCIVAGLSIGVANYALLNFILLTRLRRISEVAGQISRKDLTFTCQMESNDTIGEIIDSFNSMVADLRSLIGQTSNLSGSVLKDSANISSILANINGDVGAQSGSATEINHAIEHLAHTVQSISSSSSEAASQARETARVANEGGSVVQQSIQGMDKISQVVEEAAQAVDNLGQSSQQIGAIVAVIKEIAEQTNLLALNAAIEAARAGEQGRGFAVVADEVRKLAEKTTQATQEISGMIDSIQQETQQAVRSMSMGTAEVRNGVTMTHQAGEALQEIVIKVDQVSHMIEGIAASTSQQEADVTNIKDNIEQISSLISGTFSNTQMGAEQAQALSQISSQLDDLVKGFRLA